MLSCRWGTRPQVRLQQVAVRLYGNAGHSGQRRAGRDRNHWHCEYCHGLCCRNDADSTWVNRYMELLEWWGRRLRPY